MTITVEQQITVFDIVVSQDNNVVTIQPTINTGQSGGGGDVISVNGQQGVVVLTTNDIQEDDDRNYVTDAEKVAISQNSADIQTNATNINTVEASALLNATNIGVNNASIEALNNKFVTVTDANVSGSYEIDWSIASSWILTLTGDTTLTFANVPAVGFNDTITLYITGEFNLDIPLVLLDHIFGNLYDGASLNQFVIEKAGSVYWTNVSN